MKVALDCTPLSTHSRFRGIGTYVRGLVRGLAHLPRSPDDPEIVLLLGRVPNVQALPLPANGEVPERFLREAPIPTYAQYAWYKRASVGRALRAARVDLYHATDPKGTPRPRGYKTLSVCHDLIPSILGGPYLPPFVPRRASMWIDRARYGVADHLIAISETTRQDVIRLAGVAPERVSVVHHGIDHESYRPAPAPEDTEQVHRVLGSDRPYFLYAGGYDARKQVPLLVSAFAQRARELDELLVLAGSMRPRLRQSLHALAARCGVAERVCFAGFVEPGAIPALYRGATAHPLLTLYEGFGLTLLEAMACGCPVLSLRASCVPEVVGDGALLLPEAADADDVGDALVRLATDSELRQDLRARGIARAERFTWDACAAETLRVYRHVLTGTR